MKLTKMPKIDVAELSAEEFLVAFYVALGWNRKDSLDAKRVTINKKQWVELCDQLKQNDKDAPLLMMNYGPSGRDEVPYGKVQLGKEWITAA